MKERSILFKDEMVKAILDGRKTQTRRIIKPQPEYIGKVNGINYDWVMRWKDGSGENCFSEQGIKDMFPILGVCPYGHVGDRLWVRESFYIQPELWARDHKEQPLHYTADGLTECLEDYIKKPSLFMPHWASRITLEITGLRVERVQDISEEDAEKEGCPDLFINGINFVIPSLWYQELWDKINGKKYPWKSNPWVWVIEFRKL